jgi:thiol-disulfide isomerase/thioredoxin
VKISRHAEDDARIPILKEAVDSVNKLKTQESYRGQENPETAYHFMVVLGELAELTLPINEVASSKIRLCQGKIARNLGANPGFPADSKESLASSLIAAAQGHAINGEQKLALEAIKDAYELGFCEFDKLRSDELLARMSDQETFLTYLGQLEAAYKVKVKKWSKQAISEFQPFKFEFKVEDVEGGSLTNGSFDEQVLVVDFWATWCPPCRKSIPHFIELQNEFGQEGVQVVGISMDSPEDPESSVETVKEFADENGFTYPCGMGTNDLTQRIPGEVKLPTTLFVDRLGNVRYVATGYQDYTKMAAIVETLAEEDQHVRVTTAR